MQSDEFILCKIKILMLKIVFQIHPYIKRWFKYSTNILLLLSFMLYTFINYLLFRKLIFSWPIMLYYYLSIYNFDHWKIEIADIGSRPIFCLAWLRMQILGGQNSVYCSWSLNDPHRLFFYFCFCAYFRLG